MESAVERNEAVERVWRRLPSEAREALMVGMTPTDLQTLLLSVSRARAERVGASRLMQRWREDRFVRPAVADPRRLAELDAHLWHHLPSEFEGLVLAPVAPLGSCAVTADVDQNRIVSTVRGSEVVSDPTNVLAIEAAVRRRRTDEDVHLAACHRVCVVSYLPSQTHERTLSCSHWFPAGETVALAARNQTSWACTFAPGRRCSRRRSGSGRTRWSCPPSAIGNWPR